MQFESSVISSDSKTGHEKCNLLLWFESSVISSGSKTVGVGLKFDYEFESSVISSGSKTRPQCFPSIRWFESTKVFLFRQHPFVFCEV